MAARFAVLFDFPVPPRKEWIEMIFDIYAYSCKFYAGDNKRVRAIILPQLAGAAAPADREPLPLPFRARAQESWVADRDGGAEGASPTTHAPI